MLKSTESFPESHCNPLISTDAIFLKDQRMVCDVFTRVVATDSRDFITTPSSIFDRVNLDLLLFSMSPKLYSNYMFPLLVVVLKLWL